MPQNRRETHGASAIQRNENQPKKCYYKKIHGFQEESDSLIFFFQVCFVLINIDSFKILLFCFYVFAKRGFFFFFRIMMGDEKE